MWTAPVHRLAPILLLVAVALTSSPARAADPPVRVAAGPGMGVGLRASSADLRPLGPELGLPGLELGFHGPAEHSVELSIPVLKMIAAPLLVERAWIGLDGYRCWRREVSPRVWAVAGPGVGWMASFGAGNGTGGVRLGGRLGIELRSPEERFALSLLVQPGALLELGDLGAAVSGGAMLWVRWTWTRR